MQTHSIATCSIAAVPSTALRHQHPLSTMCLACHDCNAALTFPSKALLDGLLGTGLHPWLGPLSSSRPLVTSR